MTENDRSADFTDEEAAFPRHARFGELPPRVRPEDRVESTDTGSRTEVPEQAFDVEEFGEAGRL